MRVDPREDHRGLAHFAESSEQNVPVPLSSNGFRLGLKRHRDWQASAAVVGLAVVMLGLLGCSYEDPEHTALRRQFLLDEEPDSPTTIAEAKSAASENPNVSFVGRIAYDEDEAFVPGQAVFVVTEILPGEHDHGGKQHADNCPFCKRKAAKAPRAAVQVVGDSGEPLDVDARELFGMQTGDTVVVRGQGQVLAPLDLFQVTADGIYLRRSKEDQ